MASEIDMTGSRLGRLQPPVGRSAAVAGAAAAVPSLQPNWLRCSAIQLSRDRPCYVRRDGVRTTPPQAHRRRHAPVHSVCPHTGRGRSRPPLRAGRRRVRGPRVRADRGRSSRLGGPAGGAAPDGRRAKQASLCPVDKTGMSLKVECFGRWVCCQTIPAAAHTCRLKLRPSCAPRASGLAPLLRIVIAVLWLKFSIQTIGPRLAPEVADQVQQHGRAWQQWQPALMD